MGNPAHRVLEAGRPWGNLVRKVVGLERASEPGVMDGGCRVGKASGLHKWAG